MFVIKFKRKHQTKAVKNLVANYFMMSAISLLQSKNPHNLCLLNYLLLVSWDIHFGLDWQREVVLFWFFFGEIFYCSQPGTKYLHKVNNTTGRHESLGAELRNSRRKKALYKVYFLMGR